MPLRSVMLGTFLYLCAIRFVGVVTTLGDRAGWRARAVRWPGLDARTLAAMFLILELSVVWFGVGRLVGRPLRRLPADA